MLAVLALFALSPLGLATLFAVLITAIAFWNAGRY
jgi:hypothetical protein